MQSGLYVNLSGQIALERRLATIANNVANVGTVGYRAEELKFDTVLSMVGATPTAYSTAGESFISERSGGLNKTGNPLDVAVQGKGWLAIQTPAGIAYTRDGRMQLQESGGKGRTSAHRKTLKGRPVAGFVNHGAFYCVVGSSTDNSLTVKDLDPILDQVCLTLGLEKCQRPGASKYTATASR